MPTDSQLGNARIRGVIVTLAVIAVLYLGRAVFIPIALAVLVSFVLAPLVKRIDQLGVGRVLSVVGVISGCSLLLATLGWITGIQLVELSSNLPGYKGNLVKRVEDLRSFAPSGLNSALDALADIEQEVMETGDSLSETSDDRTQKPDAANDESSSSSTEQNLASDENRQKVGRADDKPVEVAIVSTRSSPISQLMGMVNPVLGPLGTFGIVVVLAIFILLDREDFRNRVVQLLGSSNIAIATRAISDATDRSITWLRTMVFINGMYAIAVATGLHFFGLPNALLWGGLAFFCRFVPYIGPWIGAAFPVLLSLAVFEGWAIPLGVVVLYIVLETIVNTVLEPWLYGRSLGLTSIGIILAAIFWTYMWGPAGLLIAVPITMWLVVLGHHVPQMSAFTILFGDMSEMPSYHSLYQRLLAFDAAEAEVIMDRHFKNDNPSEVLAQVFSPLFAKLELDRRSGFIEDAQEKFVYQTIASHVKELVEIAVVKKQTVAVSDSDAELRQPEIEVLIVPSGNEPEEIMSEMLHLGCLHELELDVEVASSALLVNELLEKLETEKFDAAVFCCESVASESKMRLVCKRLTNADQKVPIFVLKSNGRTDSASLTSNRPASLETRFDTISDVLEKLRQVNRRLPQAVQASAAEINSAESEPSGLVVA